MIYFRLCIGHARELGGRSERNFMMMADLLLERAFQVLAPRAEAQPAGKTAACELALSRSGYFFTMKGQSDCGLPCSFQYDMSKYFDRWNFP